MSLKKRFTAAAAAVIMAFSLAGCGKNTTYIMKADGEEIASGVYINLMLSEYTNQIYSLYYSGGEIAETFEAQMMGDQKMSAYLEDYAYSTCQKIAAVEKRCEELGISLTDDELNEIKETVNSTWEENSDYYHEMGVSKESLTRVQSYSYLYEKLFEAYYYEGGVEEVTSEELTSYVNENFLRYKIIQISTDDEEPEAAKEMCDKYMGYAEEGKTMDELIEMYEAETAAEEETTTEDTAGDDETADDAASDEVTDETTDEEAVEGEVETYEASAEEEAEEEETSDEEASEGAEAEDAEAEEEEEKTASELESEKYPNEYTRNKASYEDDEFINFIDSLEFGVISSYSDDYGYYIIERLDIAERTEFPEANKESIISAMKTDAFADAIQSIVDSMKFEKNEKSVKRYKAVDVVARQQDYYDSQSES